MNIKIAKGLWKMYSSMVFLLAVYNLRREWTNAAHFIHLNRLHYIADRDQRGREGVVVQILARRTLNVRYMQISIDEAIQRLSLV
jgi:hypothetical protein